MSTKAAVAVVYVAVMFITMMDTTIVNVALPSIAESMGRRASDVDIAVVGFLVFLGLAMPASGWLSDRFGRKKIFLAGLIGFTVASLLCATATGLVELGVYRMMQGAAGGILSPVGLAMFLHAFPPSERARANRILMFPMVIAPASGPVVGGLLVDTLSWHWIFLVNIPIAVVALLFGAKYMRREELRTPAKFDLGGFLTASLGVGGLMYVLAIGPSRGWSSPDVPAAGVLGILLIAAHVRIELRSDHPLIELRLLGNRFLSRTAAVMVPSYIGFSGLLFVVPVLLQEGMHSSGLAAGLATFPEAVGVAISTQIAMRLMKHYGVRLLLVIGQIAAAAFVALLVIIIPVASIPVISLCMFLVGSAMAYSMLPGQTIAFATVDQEHNSSASTLWTLIMQLASAAGVALLSTIIASGRSAEADGLFSYRLALSCGAVLLAIAAVVASLIPGRDEVHAAMRRDDAAAAEVPGNSAMTGRELSI
ncbi:DHA2 family efflux MFS transporter permease subunit [Nocardia sp. NPDC059236]|uniref:DHA2 family efflux MFS transporter permease subunit n=1 Tax=Nocardia sp. NPDC059236 TaxID=3346783 RepID=UPI0036D0E64C